MFVVCLTYLLIVDWVLHTSNVLHPQSAYYRGPHSTSLLLMKPLHFLTSCTFIFPTHCVCCKLSSCGFGNKAQLITLLCHYTSLVQCSTQALARLLMASSWVQGSGRSRQSRRCPLSVSRRIHKLFISEIVFIVRNQVLGCQGFIAQKAKFHWSQMPGIPWGWGRVYKSKQDDSVSDLTSLSYDWFDSGINTRLSMKANCVKNWKPFDFGLTLR